MADPSKLWFQGLLLPGTNQAEQTGERRYWWRGYALPVLNSFTGPPTPPAGASALPTGLRITQFAEDAWAPLAARRFAPVPDLVAAPWRRPRGPVWPADDWAPTRRGGFVFPTPASAAQPQSWVSIIW